MKVQQLIEKAYELGTEFGVNILAALAVFIIGRWVTKFRVNFIRKLMDNREVDPTITPMKKHMSREKSY
jgi:small conductance mechanosensitive channel